MQQDNLVICTKALAPGPRPPVPAPAHTPVTTAVHPQVRHQVREVSRRTPWWPRRLLGTR